MAQFTTRIELHAATDEDYDQLHSAMKDNGFSRLIKSDDGVWYHLPWAEYNFVGAVTYTDVLNKAKTAANTTGCSYVVLVTESNGRIWHNLLPVKK